MAMLMTMMMEVELKMMNHFLTGICVRNLLLVLLLECGRLPLEFIYLSVSTI